MTPDRRFRAFFLSIVAVGIFAVSFETLPAQSNDPKSQPAENLNATLDLTVPDEPAFNVLGVSPENITRPGSPRALGLAVLQAVDPNGNDQNGLALSTTPYLLLQGRDLTLRDYQTNGLKRALSNVQLSLATAKGSSDDDEALRLAVGVRWTVFDRGDPRRDDTLIQCIGNAQARVLDKGKKDPVPPDASEEEKESRAARMEKAVEDEAEPCRKAARSRNWNKSALELGVAPTWTSPSGSSDDLDSSGWGAWLSWSNPLLKKGQWIVGARYRSNEPGADPLQPGSTIDHDLLAAGLRLRYGSARQALLLETSYQHTHPENEQSDSSYRYSLGAEIRVAEGLWLQLAAGTTRGEESGENAGFVGGQFKWGFSPKRAYDGAEK